MLDSQFSEVNNPNRIAGRYHSSRNNSRTIVKLEGMASFVVLTDTGQVRRLGTGRTLIGPDIHNLRSPSAMFKDSDSGLRYVHLEPDNSALVLHDGARVPLRWDGRLFHLDYWSTTAGAVVDAPQLCAQVLAEADYRRADATLCRHLSAATDVVLPESAFGGKDERGRDITTSMLMPHRVIEPHGLSHSGLEHRRHGHTNTAEINIDRARRGLPPIRLPPPGHRCAICEIAMSKGYVSLDADSCLYVLYDSTRHVQAAAAMFVDDCIHAGTQASCTVYRTMLQADFETSGQDKVPTDFLGMQITRDREAGTLKIFQEKYIEKMAERYGVGLPTGSRAPTPLPHTAKLDPAEVVFNGRKPLL